MLFRSHHQPFSPSPTCSVADDIISTSANARHFFTQIQYHLPSKSIQVLVWDPGMETSTWKNKSKCAILSHYPPAPPNTIHSRRRHEFPLRIDIRISLPGNRSSGTTKHGLHTPHQQNIKFQQLFFLLVATKDRLQMKHTLALKSQHTTPIQTPSTATLRY